MTDRERNDPIPDISPTDGSRKALQLLGIPFLVSLVWMIEMVLLAGRSRVFLFPEPAAVLSYTLIGCILTGMILPVLVIRRSFGSRAVTMHQIGFRSPRRAGLFLALTAAACFLYLHAAVPGTGLLPLAGIVLLYLPTGIASVMICWVLAGTHLQALVRAGGALVSISTGVVISAILFALTTFVSLPVSTSSAGAAVPIMIGGIAALFFFAVRDVYATSVLVTTGLVSLTTGMTDPAALSPAFPSVAAAAALAAASLVLIHAWLLRKYETVVVVRDT